MSAGGVGPASRQAVIGLPAPRSALLMLVFPVLFLCAGCRGGPRGSGDDFPDAPDESRTPSGHRHPYVGLWVTADGYVRQELLPDGRYVEARGDRDAAYTGRYEVQERHILYWDDSGFEADGEFRGGVLHHGGMVMHRAAGGAEG